MKVLALVLVALASRAVAQPAEHRVLTPEVSGSIPDGPSIPGQRVTWRHAPTPAEFAALAGDHGFVVALDAPRWDFVLTKVELGAAARQETDAARGLADARAEVIAALKAELDASEAARQKAELDALEWRVKALRPRGRWTALFAGFGAGMVADRLIDRIP